MSQAGISAARMRRWRRRCTSHFSSTRELLLLAICLVLLGTRNAQTSVNQTDCARAFYRCDSVKCIAQSQWCDGVQHCDDGTDEDYNKCHDDSGSFQHVRQKLNRSHGVSTKQCELELSNAFNSCQCSRGSWLACKRINLQQIPVDIPGNVTRLLIQGNQIHNLSGLHCSQYPKLAVVYLDDNPLEAIANDSFNGCTNLRVLSLARTSLQQLPARLCQDCGAAQELFLQENEINSIGLDTFVGLHSLRMLNLSNNKLASVENQMFREMSNLNFLFLSSNQLSEITNDAFSSLLSLSFLFIDNNRITSLHPDCFAALTVLTEIDLSNNRISELPVDLFATNTLMEKIDLSYNPVDSMPAALFRSTTRLKSLTLLGLSIRNIKESLFIPMIQLQHVYFDKFSYCSYAWHAPDCHPKGDGISSNRDLLSSPVHRGFIWFVAIISIGCNIAVISCRVTIQQEQKTHSFLVKNLNAADCLMGVYLVIIAFYDIKYRNVYQKESFTWRLSWQCQAAGILAMTSYQVSLFTVTYMSVERFLCIVYPFAYSPQFFAKRVASQVLFVIWIVGMLIAIVPIFLTSVFGARYYADNGLCFPLHIHEPFSSGWQYSAFVFLAVDAVAVSLMTYAYLRMFQSVYNTRKCSGRGRYVLTDDLNYAKRFFGIALTNIVCLLPIIVVKILALAGIPISTTVYAWMSIFVLPINSSINPLLYSLTVSSFREDVVRRLCALRRHPCEAADQSTVMLNVVGTGHGAPSSESGTRVDEVQTLV